MIKTIAIHGYRTLRELRLGLSKINIIEGANGSGKTNIYRALRLIVDAAEGRLVQSLAREGGLSSVLWAGPEVISREMMLGITPIQGTARKGPVRLLLGMSSDQFTYMIDLGLPIPSPSAFTLDPVIKREWLWAGSKASSANLLVDRKNEQLRCRPGDDWIDIDISLGSTQSVLGEYSDPSNAPQLILLRDWLRSWRFYDQMRTDSQSPARLPCVGTFTPVLSGDGRDLAAALQTILEIGNAPLLQQTIQDAFPGSQLLIDVQATLFRVGLHQTGMLRPMFATELSDGTLRYLLLAAALLTPRPPQLMVLNEPETSLHPELLPALGRLIAAYGRDNQVIVVTHAQPLIDALCQQPQSVHFQLEKQFGATQIANIDRFELPAWSWPKR
jgi:predicted ATPase